MKPVKPIHRKGETSPHRDAIAFANANGFELQSEAAGKGRIIEVHQGGKYIDYRRSYSAALTLMKRLLEGGV